MYNDIDENLVNFWMILRDYPEDFFEAVNTLPVSRALYEEYKWQPLPDDPFLRAVQWWYLARNSYGGVQRYKVGWQHSKTINCAKTYYRACELAMQMMERFKNVQIECLDFRKLIPIYDSPTTLYYADPPYRGRELYYQGEFSDQDHRDLADLLSAVKGKVVVSYYEDELINDLYKGWNKLTKDYALLINNNSEKRSRNIEVLYLNYDPPKEMSLFDLGCNYHR